MAMLYLLSALILVVAGAFTLGRLGAKHREKSPAVVKAFLLGYIIFAGCFVFPILSPVEPLDFSKIYLLVVSYGVIGLGFAGVYGEKKEKTVYLLTLVLTAAGLFCRYVLEYGEASNTYNFTLVNVASYLVLMPAFTALAYNYLVEYLRSKS